MMSCKEEKIFTIVLKKEEEQILFFGILEMVQAGILLDLARLIIPIIFLETLQFKLQLLLVVEQQVVLIQLLFQCMFYRDRPQTALGRSKG